MSPASSSSLAQLAARALGAAGGAALLDDFARLAPNTQLLVVGAVAGALAAAAAILTWGLLRLARRGAGNEARGADGSAKPHVSAVAPPPPAPVKIPDTVFKDHSMVLSRPTSSSSLV